MADDALRIIAGSALGRVYGTRCRKQSNAFAGAMAKAAQSASGLSGDRKIRTEKKK